MSNIDVVKKFLNTEGVGFESDDELACVRFSFSGETVTWSVLVHDLAESQRLAVLSFIPSMAEEETRAQVSEFIHRCNYGLVVGNFELDVDTGEIRFRTSADLDDIEVNSALVRNLIYGNVGVVNDYLPGLNKVIHGGMDAASAIEMIEGPST